MERRGHRRLPEDRPQRHHRRDRPHGRSRHVHRLQADRRRPQGDRDVSEEPSRRDRPEVRSRRIGLEDEGGEAIYRDQCSACHSLDGKGVAFLFPALAGSANVHSDDPTSLIRVVLQGARSVATDKEPTGPGMPSFAWKLDDDEVAAVLTYARNSWGGSATRSPPRRSERFGRP